MILKAITIPTMYYHFVSVQYIFKPHLATNTLINNLFIIYYFKILTFLTQTQHQTSA